MDMNASFPNGEPQSYIGFLSKACLNSFKVESNSDLKNDCYSLWETSTITGDQSTQDVQSSLMDVNGNIDSSNGNSTTGNRGIERLLRMKCDTLLGPYSQPETYVSPYQNGAPALHKRIQPARFPPRVPLQGMNWSSNADSVSNFMHFNYDINNNVIARPTWLARQSSSSPPSPSPLLSSMSGKSMENYFVAKWNGEKICKPKACYASRSNERPPKPVVDRPKRIHVSNIPFWMVENDLLILFKDYGCVQEVQVITNEKGSKGFGFVTFKKASEADRAKFEMDGAVVDGRVIEVNDAHPKNHQRNTLIRLDSSESSA